MQTLEIRDWMPQTNPNRRAGHPLVEHKRHKADQTMAWAAAKQAGWQFVPGKVRLTVTLVYPSRRYLPDHDNAVARCKGLIDGLKGQQHLTLDLRKAGEVGMITQTNGFFRDDSSEWLELVVEAIVEPKTRAVRLCLEPLA